MIVEYGVLSRGYRPAASVEAALAGAAAGAGVAWVALQDPDEAEIETVLGGVDQGRPAALVADRRWGHAGFVGLREHLLVTLVEVDDDSADLAPIALQALLGPGHLVLVRRGGRPGAVTDLRHQVEEWLAELVEDRPPAPWVALAAMLFVFFDRYDRVLRRIEDGVGGLNDRVFPAPDDSVLEDTYRIDQRIMRIGRAMRPLAHGLAEVAADGRLEGDPDVRRAVVRLRTVAEDLVERVTWAEQTVSSLVSTMLGLTAQRTNDLSTRQAAVAQRISAYALLFAIPNALFALYGTNFEHLPKILTREYGYPTLLGLTAVLMAVTAWRLRRNGWL